MFDPHGVLKPHQDVRRFRVEINIILCVPGLKRIVSPELHFSRDEKADGYVGAK